ncbi:MAG: serine protease [candidate division WOR-3 bacterium]|nr:serine protease [candidate division WOR-3 bacterium]
MNITKIFAKVKNAIVRVETEGGFGTGIVVDKRGIILTNHHVVELENIATLYFYNGKIEIGKIIYANRARDIAFIYINQQNLYEAKLSYLQKTKIGEEIIAITNPGSSGGPIINRMGEVVGMTCMGFSEGLNLAIPISDIKSYLLDIKKMLQLV